MPRSSASQQAQLAALEGEQFLFRGQAAAVTGELAVAANHAMAGDHNWNRVRAVRQAHCARGVGMADVASDLAVRKRFAVRNVAEPSPDLELKRRSLWGQRKSEALQLSREIGGKLADGFLERSPILVPDRIGPHDALSLQEQDLPQPASVRCQQQRADRGLHLGV
jgi:hypothetical protein